MVTAKSRKPGACSCVLIDLCRYFDFPLSSVPPVRAESAGSAQLFQV
jgi:hypothetical protein